MSIARALAVAAVLAFGSVGAGEIPGTEIVQRAPLPPNESSVDDVMATMELEGDATPRVVLRSEYTLLLRTDLLSRGAADALRVEVHVSVAESILEQLMAEQFILREAERAHEAEVTTTELADARAQLTGRFPADTDLHALLSATNCTDDEFSLMLRRRFVVERYLVAHAPRLIEPSESDLRQAFADHRFGHALDGVTTLSAARATLHDALIHAQAPSAARQFLRAIGSRVRERVFVTLTAGPGGE